MTLPSNMATNYEIAIFGIGGHGRELAWIAQRSAGRPSSVVYVIDDVSELAPSKDRLVVDVRNFIENYIHVPLLIGVGNPQARLAIADRLAASGASFARFTDPSALVGDRSLLAEGTIVGPNSVITVDAVVGAHTHFNAGCVVSHDVHIGRGCHFSPGVRVAGHVTVGDAVFFGIGATVINGTPDNPLRIGDGAVIGAGACVVGDVAARTTVVGVPARIVNNR